MNIKVINMSNLNYSFKDWCNENNRLDLLERWDYSRNGCSPETVSFKSNNKYYFKCPANLHDSEFFKICDIHKSKYPLLKCKKCNSFAQIIINTYGKKYLNDIWSFKNDISPWDVSAHSNKQYYIVCQTNKEHVYSTSLDHYMRGVGCPYCSHHKIGNDNSLGIEYPEVLSIWSDKNTSNPFEFAPHSSELVWWKCNKGIHDDYQRTITRSNSRNFICPKCGKEQGWINRKEDITGQRYGCLTALEIDISKNNNKKRTYWICECVCGNQCSINITNLKNGNTTTCGDRSKHYSQEHNGHWKGGITPKLISARNCNRYDQWRDAVYKKCWYTCQCCGEYKEIIKNAHHIRNFASNEDLRYDKNNGILLCEQCHAFKIPGSFHYVYGSKDNTPEQLEEYINKKRKELGINKIFKIIEYQSGDVLKPKNIL